jgi:hypothetical protein
MFQGLKSTPSCFQAKFSEPFISDLFISNLFISNLFISDPFQGLCYAYNTPKHTRQQPPTTTKLTLMLHANGSQASRKVRYQLLSPRLRFPDHQEPEARKSTSIFP